MKLLHMTIGLPRSGKTTWAQSTPFPIVCPDQIRLALHGQRYQALAEPMVWAIAKVMVRALFLAGHEDVVLDATNTTRARREEWRSGEWTRVFMPITASKETCLSRADALGDAYIKPIIERMAAAYEPISAEELED